MSFRHRHSARRGVYFDLACPYGTVEYFIDHMNVPAEVRRNVTIEYYEAGHMMFVRPASMVKFKAPSVRSSTRRAAAFLGAIERAVRAVRR